MSEKSLISGTRRLCLLLLLSAVMTAVADDRKLFYLKGPVKTATFDAVISFQSFPANEPVTRSFSEDGTLLPNDELGEMTVTREEDSVTFRYESWKGNHQETFRITPEGYLRGFTGKSEDLEYEYTLSTGNGDLDLETIIVTSPTGNKTYSAAVYKVIERDKYGNWTRRTAKINRSYIREETCKITYYE